MIWKNKVKLITLKKLHWHTTFGNVKIIEQIFHSQKGIYRPFGERYRVFCRYYSRSLQRAVTDFGADVSFQQASEKMKEHYGIEIPACSIRKITRDYAEEIAERSPQSVVGKAQLLVAEMDGGMVPIVELEQGKESDLRKTRKVCWKEAKLCFAREHKKITRFYGAMIGTPEEAGTKLYECAKRAGLIETTYVHALGDGATMDC